MTSDPASGNDGLRSVLESHHRLEPSVVVSGPHGQPRRPAPEKAARLARWIDPAQDAQEGILLPFLADLRSLAVTWKDDHAGGQGHQTLEKRLAELFER